MSSAQLDHLVVLADTLQAGVAWCEATLGVTPDAGGRHAFMGTCNRLLRISSDAFVHSYLEIIAIDPEGAAPSGKKRWFDMDDAALQATVRMQGPQLVHWVARVPDIALATQALQQRQLPAGLPQAASRMTQRGLLEWQIGLHGDGVRPMGGCLPTLIEWAGPHPESGLQNSGVQLLALELHHPRADQLADGLHAIGWASPTTLTIRPATAPQLRAQLHTPRGLVWLQSAH